MKQGAILCDVTEFVANPVTTGIQRVTYAIASNWPSAPPLVPVHVTPDGCMRRLPNNTWPKMAELFTVSDAERERARKDFQRCSRNTRALSATDIASFGALFNPELFYCPKRISLYRNLVKQVPNRVFMIVYDFIPWLQPQWFSHDAWTNTMDYLRLLRGVENLAFISEQTRHDFLHRMVRQSQSVGPVLSLGSDGLGTARPGFTAGHRRFTMVGSVEPRKNIGSVLDAFELLWATGSDVELCIVGRHVPMENIERERMEELAQREPRFRHYENLGDKELRACITGSRATLFVSKAEGFGIPPLESLALGVPVIVSANIPSLASLPALGQVRLSEPSGENIAAAVRQLMDDEFAATKYREIESLRLPLWSDLARDVRNWIVEATCATESSTASEPAAAGHQHSHAIQLLRTSVLAGEAAADLSERCSSAPGFCIEATAGAP